MFAQELLAYPTPLPHVRLEVGRWSLRYWSLMHSTASAFNCDSRATRLIADA